MPLPTVILHPTLQCHAKAKRSCVRCLNLAAYGMSVCRFHGARRPETILRSSDHPQFRHGRETLVARAKHRAGAVQLRLLQELMHSLGMTSAPRTPGPKPGSKRI